MEFLQSSRRGIPDLGLISTSRRGWTTPARGLRIPEDLDLSHEVLTHGAIHAFPRTAVAVDLTAAYLWGAVTPSGFGLEVDAQACAVATTRGTQRPRAGGLRGRRLELPPEHVTELNGVPITTPARTWLDCVPLTHWSDPVAMGDAMLRTQLATLNDFREVIIWGRGRRGIRAARAAFELLDARSESPGESWVRVRLVRGGLPRPVCNLTVEVGSYVFRLDIAWERYRVAVEYDGEEFHGPERYAHDLWRRELLRAAGWQVFVVRKSDIADPTLISRVHDALVERGYVAE